MDAIFRGRKLLPALLRNIKPDIIVNAAAYTAVDKAEQEEQLATTVNGTAVGVLADEARKAGILLVHYSTDYVFDGAKQSPYTEDDIPHPINAYGRSKLTGETAMRQAGGAYVILRSSWIYAGRGHNFVRTILRLAGERDELRIVDDQIGAPTWARDIADATASIVRAARQEQARGRLYFGNFQSDRVRSDKLAWVCQSHSGGCNAPRLAATPAASQADTKCRVSDAGRQAEEFRSCRRASAQAVWIRGSRLAAEAIRLYRGNESGQVNPRPRNDPEPPRKGPIGASAKAIDFMWLFGQLRECDWALAGKQKIAQSL